MSTQQNKPMPNTSTNAAEPDTARALLNAARDIFEREGVKGISVRRVADRAGCTTMAVYSRFSGKDGILGALFDEGFDKLACAQQTVKPSLQDAARVLALCRAYRAVALAHPHHYALMLGHFSGELTPSPASQAKALSTLDCLADAVAAMSGMQGKSRVACVTVAHQLFAFCHGWVSLEHMRFVASGKQSDTAFDRAVLALAKANT